MTNTLKCPNCETFFDFSDYNKQILDKIMLNLQNFINNLQNGK